MFVESRTNRCRALYAIVAGMLLVCLLPMAGCANLGAKPTGPATTDTTSAAYSTLQERIEFLQRYVSFRRNYESLDFAIRFRNGGDGGLPSPSEWDIRLVAVVPESEIAAWIPAGATASKEKPDVDWLKTVPTSLDLSGVDEWYVDARYVDNQQTVAVDRARRIVVYRNLVY